MRFLLATISVFCLLHSAVVANPVLLKKHCRACHHGDDAEADFNLAALSDSPTASNLDAWLASLDRVKSGEMPPAEESNLSDSERRDLVDYLRRQLATFDREQSTLKPKFVPRRMNNREFAQSIADVLLIEDIGTHLPTDNLVGDSRHHGFDTHSQTLGFSKFHLEQCIRSARQIVNATILDGEKPQSKRYQVTSRQIFAESLSQNTNRPERQGASKGFDFLDPRRQAYFKPFKHVPSTGWYRIRIQAIALDRGRYDTEGTGVYDGDPIQLLVQMGDRKHFIDLPDHEIHQIDLTEWMAEGSRLKFQNPTDGLKMVGNGNFKFQNRLTGEYFKKYEPDRYAQLVKTFTKKRNGRLFPTSAWQNWVNDWMGPRPRILSAEIEGPIYPAWPPARQTALIGANPKIEDAHAILKPIAERAWRRPVRDGELDEILHLVHRVHQTSGIIEALKEGIVTVLASPQFLLLNTEDLSEQERFASKFSYFLYGTTPTHPLRQAVAAGSLNSQAAIVQELKQRIASKETASFQREFPYAWLELSDINFMAPDPDKYHHYHRKDVSEDMIGEVLELFNHALKENISVPELLLADYSFVNADLAKVYGLEDVPQDSTFRKYVFQDGNRGGLITTGAFLTSTADSLFTSPIHRAIYVMENFLGIHPTPPPADVEITEPDVRQAKTIKEILSAHRSDKNCLSCHQLIDPYGYAFENYGPDGSWRHTYTVQSEMDKATKASATKRAKPQVTKIAIDAGATFQSGASYSNLRGYRDILASKVNQERIVRCFVTKLLTYANGVEPSSADFAQVDRIVAVSARHNYRIVETIAAVIDSPLFREQ